MDFFGPTGVISRRKNSLASPFSLVGSTPSSSTVILTAVAKNEEVQGLSSSELSLRL